MVLAKKKHLKLNFLKLTILLFFLSILSLVKALKSDNDMRERDWVKKFDEVREKIAEQQIYTDKVKSEVEKKLLQVCSH